MVLDRVENALVYRGLAPGMAAALEALREGAVGRLPPGRHDLDGDRLYAMVQQYAAKPLDDCAWEAHRRYIDLQWVVEGCEMMGHAPIAAMKLVTPYDDQRDVAFYKGRGQLVRVEAGWFTIFFPHDVHMPMVAASPRGAPVRKVVFKIAVG